MAWNESGPGRDPWTQGPGGKRGPAPPDLEEWLKRLRARFGRRPAGAPSPALYGVVAGLALCLWLLSGLFVVDEQERAVVLRFGALDRVADSGLHWHIPWPVERIERVNTTEVRQDKESLALLTHDENLVNVDLVVLFRIASPEDYLFKLADADAVVRSASRSAATQAVGAVGIEEALGDGRQKLADRIHRLLQDRLDHYQSGLAITDVSVQRTQPPDEVVAAFGDAFTARENSERIVEDAQAYAKSRLPKARGEAAGQLADAQAYRDQAIARAEGDAARFAAILDEYRKSPKITRERLYLETMSEVYAKAGRVMVDLDKGSPTVYLPLEQLLQGTAKSEAPAPADASAPGTSDHPATGAAPTDRPRDRGGR